MKAYDREKVICDCLKHKNKMDAEMFGISKVVKPYWSNLEKIQRNSNDLRRAGQVKAQG